MCTFECVTTYSRATLPVRWIPSHVPPANSSRPDKTWCGSTPSSPNEWNWAFWVGLSKNSSRLVQSILIEWVSSSSSTEYRNIAHRAYSGCSRVHMPIHISPRKLKSVESSKFERSKSILITLCGEINIVPTVSGTLLFKQWSLSSLIMAHPQSKWESSIKTNNHGKEPDLSLYLFFFLF